MEDSSPLIFIVDDDNSVRRSLRRLLKAAGFNVKTFDSAQSFLDSYEEGGASCLVLDVRMPMMSGLDLQQILIESGSKIPIIFITAHVNSELRDRAMNAGAAAFLRGFSLISGNITFISGFAGVGLVNSLFNVL